MPRIKIISNPYQKQVRYQKWSTDEDLWIEIDYENSHNSKLLNRELTGGFFPFRAKRIVDLLIGEYGTDEEKLELYFEGSADEYQELQDVCADEQYSGKVLLNQVGIYLENARDILPAVRNLFQEMSPLIVSSVSQEKIQRDLSRFTDASSDVVPICVLGNYSTGKSTFINALIGSEILPSGNEPVTAKIYKISRSKHTDRAFIKCQYLGYDVVVHFTDKETKLELGTIQNALTKRIKETLAEFDGESIAFRVNTVLSVINDYDERESETPEISDLIEVEIPFVNGVLAETQHPFVIFDTPGSNSASNARHLQVLKEAMANMTNGLPIFLSTPDSLDSTDNENLYKIIRDMEELDNRFTMIVVNKADSAGIQRRGSTTVEQNRVLSQAVPRNLYSGGLFYVSSILGLGAKTDGEFVDYVYEDIYDAQVSRYEDPSHKHYRTLYLFNIQPAQLKLKADAAAAQREDLVYANSGLFTIEKEIETFAGKYSAYNKCFQSQMFLIRVIQITGEEIEDKKVECEGIRQSIKEKLEADKKALIDRMDSASTMQRDEYVGAYPEYMKEYVTSAEETFTVQELRDQEAVFTQEHEASLGYEGRTDEAQNARSSMASNFKSNVSSAFKNRSLSAIKDIAEDLRSDYEAVIDTIHAQHNTRRQADQQASDSLLRFVSEKFELKLAEIYELLDSSSRNYWTTKTEELRGILVRIVAGSDVLTDSRRKELEQIIIQYQNLTFREDSETIFDKVHFERRIKIGDQVIWESDHLNIEKLARTYNTNMVRGAKARYQNIEVSHRESAFTWIQNLLDEIYENIVDYSPELSKQAKQIRIMTEHIEELEARQVRLRQYTEQLRAMMDWKSVE